MLAVFLLPRLGRLSGMTRRLLWFVPLSRLLTPKVLTRVTTVRATQVFELDCDLGLSRVVTNPLIRKKRE